MLDAWVHRDDVKLHFIEPGKPIQSGSVESSDGKLREECVNGFWFAGSEAVRRIVEVWRRDDNGVGFHGSLGFLDRRWSELLLLGLAYAHEHVDDHRRPPASAPVP